MGSVAFRKRVGVLGLLLGLVAVGLLYRSEEFPQLTRQVNYYRTAMVGLFSGTQLPQLSPPKRLRGPLVKGATPVTDIVQDVALKPTYHYQFAAHLPEDVRQVFETAIDTYNHTGLVRLVPGKTPVGGNSLRFTTYRKQMPRERTTIELGHGGPGIITTLSPMGQTAHNEAVASLNATYPQSYNDAVAVHELGHALGLAHSQSVDSAMYPVSQGASTLSSGDVAGLRAIYQERAD